MPLPQRQFLVVRTGGAEGPEVAGSAETHTSVCPPMISGYFQMPGTNTHTHTHTQKTLYIVVELFLFYARPLGINNAGRNITKSFPWYQTECTL